MTAPSTDCLYYLGSLLFEMSRKARSEQLSNLSVGREGEGRSFPGAR